MNEKTKRHFTLIELLVVIAIIAILAALLLPAIKGAKLLADQTACLNNIKQTGTATMQYTDDNGGYFPYGYIPATSMGNDYTQCFTKQLLLPYTNDNPAVLNCSLYSPPSVTPVKKYNCYYWFNAGTSRSYGFNHRTLGCAGNSVSGWGCISSGVKCRTATIKNPSDLVEWLDNTSSIANPPGLFSDLASYHNTYYPFPHGTGRNIVNIVFVDGHGLAANFYSSYLSSPTSEGWLNQ